MAETSSHFTMTTKVSSCEPLTEEEKFIEAARNGLLEEVIEFSSKFSDDVKILSEALIMSCRFRHLNMLKWLVEHTAANVNYNCEQQWWNTPLTAACENGHLDITKYLVEICRADVNLPDTEGNTPITWACRFVSMSVSIYLLCEVSDLDVNIADCDGNTALHYAVWCSKDSKTQLHKACGDFFSNDNATEVLRLVCERGHNINVLDNDGNTPLHKACEHGHSKIVETMMLAGADETITNDEGQTPAQLAAKKGHKQLLKLLDRESLCQVILGWQKKVKISVTLRTLRLMRKRRIRNIIYPNLRRKVRGQYLRS